MTPIAPARSMPGRVGLRARLARYWRHQLVAFRRPGIEAAWVSLKGTGRGRNQDAVQVGHPFYGVADGVGGGVAGELASSEWLRWCARSVHSKDLRRGAALAGRLVEGDRELSERLSQIMPDGGCATTFAGFWSTGRCAGWLAHVGDARVYAFLPPGLAPDAIKLRQNPQTTTSQPQQDLLRQQGTGRASGWWLQGLTQDQTYARLGELVPSGGSANDPARMIGVGALGDPELSHVRLPETAYLLLCSDGLYRGLSAPRLLQMVAHQHDAVATLPQMARRLARAAQQAGSPDDVSLVLVRFNPWLGARRGYWWALGVTALLAGAFWLARGLGKLLI